MYKCKKCGCEKGYLKANDYHTGFYCANCDAWVAWVPKKDLKSNALKFQLATQAEMQQKQNAMQQKQSEITRVQAELTGMPYEVNEDVPFEVDMPSSVPPINPFIPDNATPRNEENTKTILLIEGVCDYIHKGEAVTRVSNGGRVRIEIDEHTIAIYDLITNKKIAGGNL